PLKSKFHNRDNGAQESRDHLHLLLVQQFTFRKRLGPSTHRPHNILTPKLISDDRPDFSAERSVNPIFCYSHIYSAKVLSPFKDIIKMLKLSFNKALT